MKDSKRLRALAIAAINADDDDFDAVLTDLDEIVDDDFETLWAARSELDALKRAAARLQQEIEGRMLQRLGPAGGVRLDDYYVRTTTGVTRKCVDPEGLREFLGERTFDAFNPNQARVGVLRAIAEEKELDPDHPLDAYFKQESDGKRKLSIIHVDHDSAPQYAREMQHGETRGGAR